LRRAPDDAADDVGGAEADAECGDEVDDLGDADRRDERRGGLAEQQFGTGDGGSEHGFEGSLVAFADDGVGGDDGR
jgi:hypothetical protein